MYTYLADMSRQGPCLMRFVPRRAQIRLDPQSNAAWRSGRNPVAAALQGAPFRSPQPARDLNQDTAILVTATAPKGCIKGAKPAEPS